MTYTLLEASSDLFGTLTYRDDGGAWMGFREKNDVGYWV